MSKITFKRIKDYYNFKNQIEFYKIITQKDIRNTTFTAIYILYYPNKKYNG